MKSSQGQRADDVLFPHEPEAILAAVRESITKYPVTVQMLIEGMRYMAKLSDTGVRLDDIKRAVEDVAIKDSTSIPDDQYGRHAVKVLFNSEWTTEALDAALKEAWSRSPRGRLGDAIRRCGQAMKKAVRESLLGRLLSWLVHPNTK